MASVWVARQRGKHGFEKLVAIKTILPVFASDVRFQAMFLDEARIASKIEHVNVAQILDLGEEHDVLYLAMEYVDGDALSKLNHACQKEGSRIPPGILLRILADTCAGLHEAHEMVDAGRPLEIVHRDVSPHNILVNSRGIAKLIDFGIAKARSRAGGETNSGVLKGKIQYMAPEQALGRTRRPARRHLGGRGHPLLPPLREAAVRGGEPARDVASARVGATADAAPADGPLRDQRRRPQGARVRPREPLPDGRRAPRGARARDDRRAHRDHSGRRRGVHRASTSPIARRRGSRRSTSRSPRRPSGAGWRSCSSPPERPLRPA